MRLKLLVTLIFAFILTTPVIGQGIGIMQSAEPTFSSNRMPGHSASADVTELEVVHKRLKRNLENAEQQLQLWQKSSDRAAVCHNFLILSKIYSKFGMIDSAYFFYNKALERIGGDNSELDIIARSDLLMPKVQGLVDSQALVGESLEHVRGEDSASTGYKLAGSRVLDKAMLRSNRAAAELQQRNTIIITIIILFIISLAIVGALYKQRRTQENINKLLIAKSEQIWLQSQEMQIQAEEVSKLNEDLECLNQNLENKIRSRTRMLKDQNNLLAEYAYSNAHELRAPVASVIGLVDLLSRSKLASEEEEIVGHLSKSASQLASVVKDIRIKLERNDILFFDDKESSM